MFHYCKPGFETGKKMLKSKELNDIFYIERTNLDSSDNE